MGQILKTSSFFSSGQAGEEYVSHIPIIANLASGSLIYTNTWPYTLWIQQFSLAPNGGTPNYKLTINEVVYTVSPSGTGSSQVLTATSLALANALTFNAVNREQELELDSNYSIKIDYVAGGTGSIDVFFLLAQRIPASARSSL